MKIFLQFILVFFFFLFTTAFTQVSISPASNGTDLAQSTSCGNGVPGGFFTLDNIVFTETAADDFKSSGTFLFFAPPGWQFNTASTPFASVLTFDISGAGISASVSSVMAGRITFSVTVNNTNVKEILLISNVQVQAILCDQVQAFSGNIEIWPISAQIFNIVGGENVGTLSVDPSTPLPVELASFSAILRDKEVVLNWSTATEVNNYGFDVERMKDGEDWNALGFVEGNGNSNSPKEYSFIDNTVSNAGTYYYRLKQIDNDGAYEYSKFISVNFDAPAKFDLEQNYPNPFNPSTTIRFNLPDKEFVSLKIFNTLGEQVRTLFEGNLDAGTHTYTFNAEGLPSGLYIYRLSTNTYSKTKKMLLMK